MRSKFVTVMGGLSVALSAALGLLSGLELMVFGMLRSQPEVAIQLGLALQEKTGQFVDMEAMPSLLQKQAITHGVFALLGLPIAVGLLRRKEWARKLTLLSIAGVTLSMAPQLLWGALPPQIPRWLTAGVFLVVSAIHADIMRRLMRPEIRAEFTDPAPERVR